MGRNLHRVFSASAVAAEESAATRVGADELIRLAVLNAPHWDLAVPRNRVNVEVERGHVTLTGSVDRAYLKACAERDARETARVTGVTNAIVIDGPGASPAPRSWAL